MNVVNEFATLTLGDARLENRARVMVGAVGRRPSDGFPSIYEAEAELEAHYRFVNNDRVTHQALVGAHANETWGRCSERGGATLVLHDSSTMGFSGEVLREGLTRDGNKQTFHGHFALAVAEAKAPVVHGVVGFQAYVIEDKIWLQAEPDGEFSELLVGSERWADVALEVHDGAPEGQPLIHVMDREADDYVLFSRLMEMGDDFVIRSQHNRRLGHSAVASHTSKRLFDALEGEGFALERRATLSRRSKNRPPASKRTHPPRARRKAKLSVRAGYVELLRPTAAEPVGQPTMVLGYVEVVELNPPRDAEPICWRLLTTLPVDTPEQMARVVDIYRKRWLIEEYFKSLKTGCAAEKRQGRSLKSLLTTLALLIPVAWRLLVLRACSRDRPKAPASAVIDAVELAALRHLAKKQKLPPKPTCRQVMMAIARVGGHLKSNGEPGWLVLGRGLERLLDFSAGFRAAMRITSEGAESTM